MPAAPDENELASLKDWEKHPLRNQARWAPANQKPKQGAKGARGRTSAVSAAAEGGRPRTEPDLRVPERRHSTARRGRGTGTDV